jgi:hypothetical protein
MATSSEVSKNELIPTETNTINGVNPNPYIQNIVELTEQSHVLDIDFSELSERAQLLSTEQARWIDRHNQALLLNQIELDKLKIDMANVSSDIRANAFLFKYDPECVIYNISKKHQINLCKFYFFAQSQPFSIIRFLAEYKSTFKTIDLPLKTEGAKKAFPAVHRLLIESLLNYFLIKPSYGVPNIYKDAENELALLKIASEPDTATN